MKIDYGLKMSLGIVLKIADTEEWLLQPELKAINDGLVYGEKEGYLESGLRYKYRGYLNSQDQFHGVGILNLPQKNMKIVGEYQENKMHGICIEPNFSIYEY